MRGSGSERYSNGYSQPLEIYALAFISGFQQNVVYDIVRGILKDFRLDNCIDILSQRYSLALRVMAAPEDAFDTTDHTQQERA